MQMQPRGPCDRKNSIPIENFNPGSKFSIPIIFFNLDQKFQSPSFHLWGPPSVQRRARSKISIHDRSLEIFNPEGRDRIFSIPGPSGKPAMRCSCTIHDMNRATSGLQFGSETGRIRFRTVRFQTPSSVSFLGSLSSGEQAQ